MANNLRNCGRNVHIWKSRIFVLRQRRTSGEFFVNLALSFSSRKSKIKMFKNLNFFPLKPWNNPPERNGVPLQEMRTLEEGVPLQTNHTNNK